ncbi:MAG: hypothetical protein LZF62_340230 [Nitrospira sp.]|nr:MAG: hypothetical protein LZF62_340230 [Nitrospira sp.]
MPAFSTSARANVCFDCGSGYYLAHCPNFFWVLYLRPHQNTVLLHTSLANQAIRFRNRPALEVWD